MKFYAFKDASHPFFPLSFFPFLFKRATNNPKKLCKKRDQSRRSSRERGGGLGAQKQMIHHSILLLQHELNLQVVL